MKTFDPKKLSVREMHGYLLGAVGPRPIALASTINKNGAPNLAPFSFFNVFSANPPILIFSPARRGTDGSTKHTLENVLSIPEVVINIVNHSMVQQMVLSSANFDAGVNEFEKAGFTPISSSKIRPDRVKESPVQFECKVNEVIALGDGKGSGNLVISEVIAFHIDESVIAENGKINPLKMDQVGRAGGLYYTRNTPGSMFEIGNPKAHLLGIDQLPSSLLKSKVLTGNDLAILASATQLPDETSINEHKLLELHEVFIKYADDGVRLEYELHQIAKQYLAKNNVDLAWKTLLAFND